MLPLLQVWIIDFTGYSDRQRSENSREVQQNTMSILQSHYPERLARAYVINSPWWLSLIWTVASPFVSANTKAKVLHSLTPSTWPSCTSPGRDARWRCAVVEGSPLRYICP